MALEGGGQRRKLSTALVMFAALGVMAWTTLTAKIPGVEPIAGHDVQLRHLVLVVLGGLALLTWAHRERSGSE